MADQQIPPQGTASVPPYYYMRPKKSRWWIPVVIIFGIIAAIGIIAVIGIMVVSSKFVKETVEVKQNSVLMVDLGGMVDEYVPGSPFAKFMGGERKSSFFDILTAIKRAKTDSKIKGIYYKASGSIMGFAKTDEYLQALEDFKKSGKFIYAYIETGSKMDYMRALPADKIFMPIEGVVEFNGFGISAMFMKGLFDKIGLEFYVQQFEEYKSYGETFSLKKFTPPAREELRALLNQRYKAFSDAIIKYRKMEPEFVKAALDRGVYTADSMRALGFVDSLAGENDVKEIMRGIAQGKQTKDTSKNKLNLISISSYLASEYQDKEEEHADINTQIAVIYGSGSIVTGKGNDSPFSSELQIYSGQFANYIKEARENKRIKAIILRIDSPGGSVIASEEIWNEIVKTRKVKPVYASMSDVAASGGYYMAMACDTIVAEPTTITGSIGVIAMVPNVSKMMNKLDITIDTMSTTTSSQDLNTMVPFTQRQKDKLAQLGEKTYFRFVSKVAESRHKTFDETRKVARGRVWTGEDALKNGLVDVMGGLQTTINLTKKRLGISETQKVRIRQYPEPEDEFKFLMKLFNKMNDEDEQIQLDTQVAAMIGLPKPAIMQFINSLPDDMKQSFLHINSLAKIARKENTIMAMPYLINVK